MRKIIIKAASIALTCSLIACSNSKSQVEKETTSSSEETVSNNHNNNDNVSENFHIPETIKTSNDRHLTYIKDYVGMNCANVGYESLGGDRLDEYVSTTVKLCMLNPDGSYIGVEDELLKNYVVIEQDLEPNTEMKITYQKNSDGEEYENLSEWSNITRITLRVKEVGSNNTTFDHELIKPTLPSDKYTAYVPDYVGMNLKDVGYISLGGEYRDEYGDANVKLILQSSDGAYIDPEDADVLGNYKIIGQSPEANTDIKIEYAKSSSGEEYSFTDYQSIEEVRLFVQKLDENTIQKTKEKTAAVSSDNDEKEETATSDKKEEIKESSKSTETNLNEQTYRDLTYVIKNGEVEITGVTDRNKENYTIPSEIDDKPVVGIGKAAFKNCKEMENIIIWPSLKYIEKEAFMNCSKLEDISVSSSVTVIEESVFEGCTELETAILWGSIEEFKDNCFKNCESLESISLSSSTKRVGKHAFDGCKELDSVINWGAQEFDDYCFANCVKIDSMSFGSDTKRVGAHAFDGCTELEDVLFWSRETKVDKTAFNNCPKADINQ